MSIDYRKLPAVDQIAAGRKLAERFLALPGGLPYQVIGFMTGGIMPPEAFELLARALAFAEESVPENAERPHEALGRIARGRGEGL